MTTAALGHAPLPTHTRMQRVHVGMLRSLLNTGPVQLYAPRAPMSAASPRYEVQDCSIRACYERMSIASAMPSTMPSTTAKSSEVRLERGDHLLERPFQRGVAGLVALRGQRDQPQPPPLCIVE